MSTRRVLRWNVPVDDQAHPVGGGPVLHVDCRDRVFPIEVWTLEDLPDDWPASDGTSKRWVQVFGTGHLIPEGAKHLGSTITASGALVWHLFEVKRPLHPEQEES